MPAEITQPGSGQNFGPGVSITVQDQGGGPYPDTDTWSVEIFSGTLFETLERTAALAFVHTPQTFEWLNQSPFWDISYTGGESGRLTDGSTVRIVARHKNASGLVLSQDSTDVVWQTGVGTGFQIFTTQELVGGSTGGGGFTAEDRTTIEATEQQTLSAFPSNTPGVADLVLGLGDLVDHIGSQLVVPTECADRSGRGSLVRPGGAIAVNAYGLTWSFVTIPPGFGRRDGALEVFHERILQLVRIDTDRGNNDYLGEVFDIHTDGGRIVWGFGIPKQILYDVTPGCVVRICWLIL